MGLVLVTCFLRPALGLGRGFEKSHSSILTRTVGGRSGASFGGATVVLIVTIPRNVCFVSIMWAKSALYVVFSIIVLKVKVSVGGGTTLERVLLLGGSSMIEAARFRFGC